MFLEHPLKQRSNINAFSTASSFIQWSETWNSPSETSPTLHQSPIKICDPSVTPRPTALGNNLHRVAKKTFQCPIKWYTGKNIASYLDTAQDKQLLGNYYGTLEPSLTDVGPLIFTGQHKPKQTYFLQILQIRISCKAWKSSNTKKSPTLVIPCESLF